MSKMSPGVMHSIIRYIHLCYFAVYLAGLSNAQIVIGPKEMPSQFVFCAGISIQSQVKNLNPCMMGSTSWYINKFVMIIILCRYLYTTLYPKHVLISLGVLVCLLHTLSGFVFLHNAEDIGTAFPILWMM